MPVPDPSFPESASASPPPAEYPGWDYRSPPEGLTWSRSPWYQNSRSGTGHKRESPHSSVHLQKVPPIRKCSARELPHRRTGLCGSILPLYPRSSDRFPDPSAAGSFLLQALPRSPGWCNLLPLHPAPPVPPCRCSPPKAPFRYSAQREGAETGPPDTKRPLLYSRSPQGCFP